MTLAFRMNKQLFLLLISSIYYYTCFSQNSVDTSINLFFKTNSFILDTHQYNRVKEFLTSYPNVTQIIGYTDTSGTATYNFALSKKRASTTYKVIKNNIDSIDPSIVTYYGESKELPEFWMNRRVQIRSHTTEFPILEKETVLNCRDTIRILDLENIYFLPDKPILLQESVPYIQELAKQLKTIPSGTFEIVGHVNYQSRFDSTHLKDLYNLSKLRAKAVYDYLLEFGIPATKLTYKGIGNSKPVFVSPKNDEEKRKNMRVQVIIINK